MGNGVWLILAISILESAFDFVISARQRNRAFRTEMKAYMSPQPFVEFGIGTPPIIITAMLDMRSAVITVMDSECGHLSPDYNCQRFCRKYDKLSSIYCHPLCTNVYKLDYICNSTHTYTASKSSTGRRGPPGDVREEGLNIDSEERGFGYYDRYVPIWGLWALESVRFYKRPFDRGLRKTVKVVDGVQFNRALMYAVSDITSVTKSKPLAIGLKPKHLDGTPNIITQFHTLGQIPHPIVSFSFSRNLWYRKPAYNTFTGIMTVGALDSGHCYDWVLAEALENSWDFEISDVEFMGERVADKALARINLANHDILLDHRLGTRLLKANVFSRGISDTFYNVLCDRLLSLSFSIGGHRIEVPHWILGHPAKPCDRSKSDWIPTKLSMTVERRYLEESVFEFGSYVLEGFCLGYDYGRGMVAWGKRRRLINGFF